MMTTRTGKTTKRTTKAAAKTAGLAAAVLLAAMIATACSNNREELNPPPNEGGNGTEINMPEQENGIEDPGMIDDDAGNTDGNAGDAGQSGGANGGANGGASSGGGQPSVPDAGDDTQTLQGSGTYTGQIDNHSIEIVTDEGPTAFQIDDSLTDVVNGLGSDVQVRFEYTVQEMTVGDELVRQYFLTAIEAE